MPHPLPAPLHGQAHWPPPLRFLIAVSRPCDLRDGDSDRLRKRRRSGDGGEVAGEPGHDKEGERRTGEPPLSSLSLSLSQWLANLATRRRGRRTRETLLSSLSLSISLPLPLC
eukprot:9481160-Pyramimonas_sp.AAC.1